MTNMTGGCACGAKRFTAKIGEDAKPYLCHCRMCQRASGNVSLAMVGVEEDGIAWEGEPDWYESSPIARRPFCAKCGTSLGFRYNDPSRGDDGASKMDLTVGSFDDPSVFIPVRHFGVESRHARGWIPKSLARNAFGRLSSARQTAGKRPAPPHPNNAPKEKAPRPNRDASSV